MFDRVGAALTQLRDVPPSRPFASPEDVRRRGRQRARRQVMVASVAAFVLLGAGVGVISGLATRSGRGVGPASSASPSDVTGTPFASPSAPAESPSGSPSASAIPPSRGPRDLEGLLLRPGDIAADAVRTDNVEPMENADQWMYADQCPAYRRAEYPSLDHRRGQVVAGWQLTVKNTRVALTEVVELYDAGWGARNVADIRLAEKRCDESTPYGDYPVKYEVIESGFTGNDSLLIRITQGTDQSDVVSHELVLRVGETVATVRVPYGQTDLKYMHVLADRVVQRLWSR